jgi:hypothetical protein
MIQYSNSSDCVLAMASMAFSQRDRCYMRGSIHAKRWVGMEWYTPGVSVSRLTGEFLGMVFWGLSLSLS